MLAASTPEGDHKARQRTARFGFRTTPDVKQTIERAATLSGQDLSSFTLSAAYERAMSTIQAHEVTHLAPEDHQAFLDALENPPAPTDKLRAAFARHEERVVER